MTSFSDRTHWESHPNPLSEALTKLKDIGTPIFDLTVSNPTQAKFDYPNQELLHPLLSSQNLSYHPDPRGLIRARETVCAYYAAKGILLSPDQIILTANTSEAYSLVFRLIADPGDKILAPSPSYPLLDYLATLNDIELTRYPLLAERNWGIHIPGAEALTKAIILVHPNNPTGNYVQQAELENISAFAKKQELALIVDEVFFDFEQETQDGKAPSFAGHQETLTFTLSGISKILGLPQMKLSWIIVSGPEEIRQEALKRLEIINDTYLSASTPIQNALGDWMRMQPVIHKEISSRISSNLEQLKKYFGAQALIPQGGWYSLLKLPDNANDEKISLGLLTEKNVLIHPGYLFDFEEAHLVASLLTERDVFIEGIKRTRDYFKESQSLLLST